MVDEANHSEKIASVMAAEEALRLSLRKERRLLCWACGFAAAAVANLIASIALNAWAFHRLHVAMRSGEPVQEAFDRMRKTQVPVEILLITLVAFVIAAIGFGIAWLLAIRRRRRSVPVAFR